MKWYVIKSVGRNGYFTGVTGQFRGIAFAALYENYEAAHQAVQRFQTTGWFTIEEIFLIN